MDPLIFLVDDNEQVNSLIKKKLENEGFMNLVVFNAYESLLKEINKKPQIIILDNYLDIDNDNADISLERFKELKRQLPETRIIIFSGETDPDIIHSFIFRGAYTYITKNLEALDKLVFAIKQIIHFEL
jgi:DNA-binding NtrC family response regulator